MNGVHVMSDLTLREITETSIARANRWHPGGLADWSASDWAVALAEECGEVCGAIKQLNRMRDGLRNLKAADRQLDDADAAVAKIAEECADVLLYLVLLAARFEIDLTAATVAKFNATSERYGFPERLDDGTPDGRAAISKAFE